MFTEIEIKSTTGRAYIEYYFDGARQREYNANKLGLDIFPNKAKSQADRNRLLKKLKYEFEKALEKGWNPLLYEVDKESKETGLEDSLKQTLASKLSGHYSRTYKRDLEWVCNKFLNFLTSLEKNSPISKLNPARIAEFLEEYNSSNRNYMNKRQTLNVLLPGTIQKTSRKKSPEKLHEIYEKEQMKAILSLLKEEYPKLYLVALLAYGCFLRPHEESRLLQKRHIRNNKIYLSGDENKGKKVRVVNIPDYVYKELIPFIDACSSTTDYVFTGSELLLNNDYFRTQWTRAKKKLLEKNMIRKNQTLYSFRHTGVVNAYRKVKDEYVLQRLLDHSSLVVTLKYLRGLGEIDNEDLMDALPEL